MEVLDTSGVKVYNVSAGKTIPEWLEEKKKGKSLRKNPEFRRRIELIQDFGFPGSAGRIKIAGNGQQIGAVGMYPPQVRVYDVNDLSMKFKRHLDCEIREFLFLTEDFSKMVFLRTDRTLEFHAKFGFYYKTRIPKFGRDIAYHHPSCDLFAVGVTHEIYRLNLEQGRFLKPFESQCPSINVCGINPSYGFLAVGGTNGVVELWDPRVRSHIGSLQVDKGYLTTVSGIVPENAGITAMRFSTDGLVIGVGTETGHVLLYDIRSNIPLRIKDHQFDTPIVDIKFHDRSRNVISSCKKIIRIWNKDSGNNYCYIEQNADISDVCVVPDSGLLFVANASSKMGVYYIPDLGKAPEWASFLDNLTEELEEDTTVTQYQDFKFVTREELEMLGATRLIGSPYLRAYMHGFYMDYRLYSKIRAIAKPDEYKEYIKEKIRQRMEEKRASRISAKRVAQPKVNKGVFSEKTLQKIMEDDRFSRLITDPAMRIDTTSEAYKRMRPNAKQITREIEDEYDEVEEDEDEMDVDSAEDRAALLADLEDDYGGKHSEEELDESDEDEDEDETDEEELEDTKPKKKYKLYEAKDDVAPFRSNKEAAERKRKLSTTLAKRVEQVAKEPPRTRAPTGNMVMTFIPEHLKKKQNTDDSDDRAKNKNRRSMKGLIR